MLIQIQSITVAWQWIWFYKSSLR